ncbi:hypothetical protein F7Q99_30800 [Streptomyces kaniharaensis]|uniref:Secreted protein/lipoprotein n=1 Tax=Streptomyces kaniharaensis TaxID=212423 RepID=A0A6N7KXQ2_9ACTN|nr:hypothetical protein [Streptomyces kaniharaensis]
MAFTSGHGDVNKLSAVASGAAYQKLAADLFKAQQAGLIFKGAPVTNPHVAAVDLASSPAKATMTDCLDTSNWIPVLASTGKSVVESGSPTHVFVNLVAEQVPDGTWRISQYAPEQGRTC